MLPIDLHAELGAHTPYHFVSAAAGIHALF